MLIHKAGTDDLERITGECSDNHDGDKKTVELAMNQNNAVVRCESCGTKNRIPVKRIKEGPLCGKCRSPLNLGGSPVNVSDQTFSHEVLSHPGPVLVDCWAPWCGPCRMVAPVIDQLAAEYAGRVKIAKLNVDENPATASQYRIQSIPTLLVFKNGTQVDQLVGAQPKQEIERHLGAVL
jgi:thioredoxin 2